LVMLRLPRMRVLVNANRVVTGVDVTVPLAGRPASCSAVALLVDRAGEPVGMPSTCAEPEPPDVVIVKVCRTRCRRSPR